MFNGTPLDNVAIYEYFNLEYHPVNISCDMFDECWSVKPMQYDDILIILRGTGTISKLDFMFNDSTAAHPEIRFYGYLMGDYNIAANILPHYMYVTAAGSDVAAMNYVEQGGFGVNFGEGPNCACGDICVNTTGWWRDDNITFYPSDIPVQAAIDNATVWDTICVKNGTYNENVDVDKQLTLISETGADSTIVSALDPTDHVFEVTADSVKICGFSVQDATGKTGIYLYDADYCNISDNTASNDTVGIGLNHSNYNNITSNTASENADCGIYLESSSYNTIYNNYFNNTNNAYDTGNNIWNTTPTPGTNIIGGSWLGGNYWSNYEGADTNGDGLGDTLLPYNSSITNGGDYHPLVTPGFAAPNITSSAPESPVNDTYCTWTKFNVSVDQTVNVTWYLDEASQHTNESVTEANYTFHADDTREHNVSALAENANGTDMQTWVWNVTAPPQPPIASFIYTPVRPAVNQILAFNASNSTDPDGGTITSYEWDFGDGTDGIGVTVNHSYSSAGSYTVFLTVTDADSAKNSSTSSFEVVNPTGGMSIVILPKIKDANAGAPCNFTIQIRNTQNFDELVNIEIRLSSILSQYQANLTWFNWTSSTSSIPAGDYRDIGLKLDIPDGISGYKYFSIIAHGTFGDSKDYGGVNVK